MAHSSKENAGDPKRPQKIAEKSDQAGSIPEVISQEISKFKQGKKSIDEKYEQSIDALKKWEKEEKSKLDALQKKLQEKFSCPIIDVSTIKLKQAIENKAKEAANLNEEQRQKDKELLDQIDSFLNGRN